MMLHRYQIDDVTLPDGTHTTLFLRGGKIFRESSGETDGGSVTRIDASGLIALPGLVDLHTHLRQPGSEQSETIFTGSQAAAAGGFTAVFAMANTNPVADSAEIVELVHDLGQQTPYVTVRPIGAVTRQLAGRELADLHGMAASRAATRVFSDDGNCVYNTALMRQALRIASNLGAVIAQHAQDPLLTENAQVNAGPITKDLELEGWPNVAEESVIARDVLLAQDTGAHLHVCHVSTAGSVEVIRWAKSRGIRVTAEVTPHHLLLTDVSARTLNSTFKVNPPLRTSEDVNALRAALADRTIDIVATDHAPHEAGKKGPWSEASFGMVGLESALSVVQTTMIDTGLMGWSDAARVLSTAPASIGRFSEHTHTFEDGAPANLTLLDPSARFTFAASNLHGLSGNSPFVGVNLTGRIEWTIHQGVPTVSHGSLVPDLE